MAVLSQKEAIKQWKELCATIQNMSTVNIAEGEAARLARIERARKDYAYFVEYYFPHYCTDKVTGDIIPSAKFHVQAAKQILGKKSLKALFKWARGHAKSTHMDVMIPMWLKCQKVTT